MCRTELRYSWAVETKNMTFATVDYATLTDVVLGGTGILKK
jgi:hypothetical protein